MFSSFCSRFFTFKNNKGEKEVEDCEKKLNVNEEYQGALRTKSYAEFFTKAAELLVNQPSSNCCCHHDFSQLLLEPGQETIAKTLESTTLSRRPDLKNLILDYFDISAEASKICTNLLKSILNIQSSYTLIQQILDINNDRFDYVAHSELRASILLNNPFATSLNTQDFEVIHDRYSSFLETLKSKRRKVARKMRLINLFNKASGVCVTTACGVVAVAAMVLAAHTLTALVMGPAILSLNIKPLMKKKMPSFRFLKSRVLREVGEQLDVAAKGTYILNRDFDTMSRLVNRLQDEIEHNRARVELCLEKRESRFSMQVLKELKKSDVGFRKQVEELEEHVCLCLVTINKSRAMVINELSSRRI